MKTAIILGATGLVGKQLLNQLLANYSFGTIKVFVRRHAGIRHPKLQEYIVDFERMEEWRNNVSGDVLFSSLGTTLKQAGSKEAQYKIDYTYQYQVAQIAAQNNVNTYVLVSAAGANPSSLIFYSRMKGALERDVMRLPFHTIHILQPGLLAGNRTEKRTGEELSYKILNIVSKLPGLRKYKPIKDIQVAKAMVHAALKVEHGIYTYTLGDLFKLADRFNASPVY